MQVYVLFALVHLAQATRTLIHIAKLQHVAFWRTNSNRDIKKVVFFQKIYTKKIIDKIKNFEKRPEEIYDKALPQNPPLKLAATSL